MSEQTKTPLIHKIALVLSVMLCIGGTLTAVMTYMQVGYDQNFLAHWLQALLSVVIIMMPIGALLMTLLSKAAATRLSQLSEMQRNLLVGVSMAVIMESIMAAITASSNIGFTDSSAFINAWGNGFIAALPVGLTIMVIMSLTIKPKIERFLKS